MARNQLQETPNSQKIIGMSSKAAQVSKMCLKVNFFTQLFVDKQIANTFINFYSKIVSYLVEKLLTVKDIFREKFVEKYYSAMNIHLNYFKFRNAKREEI